ncbi:MAG TPA: HAMP domain-containing sensor histidine kinase [Candidatus Acidoferrum sp.]|nr:HAMP domain-containing sensor histidine kinase [Candidatus Acidoferrum sp.]
MRIPLKERTISTFIVIPSVAIVITLGVLQYRWSARVSEATAVRLADSLQMSMVNWQMDFFRYFSEISLALRIDPELDSPGDVNQYARRFAEWRMAARYPRLVSAVYVLRPGRSPLQLNFSERRFESALAPQWFGEVAPELERARTVILSKNSNQQLNQSFFAVGDPISGWRFDPLIPALFHLAGPGEASEWVAIQLNRQEIEQKVLPELVQSYFQGTEGLDYQVAVLSERKAGRLLYSSDEGFGLPEPSDADGTVDIFGRPAGEPGPSPVHVFHMPSDKGTSASVRISWFPLLRKPVGKAGWRLVVRHRRGGALGAFVSEIGRRDLTIGFGVLLVLVINMAMLIVTSHRAQRLAQLQMNFVTAVSHELRTPLTVIMSGADNLSKGVVGTQQQMKQYGSVIGRQAKQLLGLVEQILLFASTRESRHPYKMATIRVHDVIDAALASTSSLIEENHVSVESKIDPALQTEGDAVALSQCIQNLISNAVKYGGAARWVGIGAHSRNGEVQISVSDRGLGIAPEDLPHIFEPFYRSAGARSAQIHGTGLGLPLSQSIASAMNGRIDVASIPGRGSTFVVHLRDAGPVLDMEPEPGEGPAVTKQRSP